MNAKIFIVAGIGAVVLGLMFYAFSVFFGSPANEPGTNQGNNQFPTAGQNQGGNGGTSLTVAEIQEGSITVRNFKDDPTTVPDPVNPGFYYLAGGANPALTDPPYQIFYDETHQYFAIQLYREPLGGYRSEAEKILQKALGITNDQMCRLNYFVGIGGEGINDLYLAKNLGFSFCPGATQLPK